jgi:hypothetical protein
MRWFVKWKKSFEKNPDHKKQIANKFQKAIYQIPNLLNIEIQKAAVIISRDQIIRHAREGGHPVTCWKPWIPACAGMTT